MSLSLLAEVSPEEAVRAGLASNPHTTPPADLAPPAPLLASRAAGPRGATADILARYWYPLQPDFFYDLDGDGKITGAKELSFAMHTAEEGDTDLEGLAKVFDSNKDGVLDANDKAFDKFRIWQDQDGDGISDAGEVKTLAEMGIKSIGVVSDGKAYTDAGNTVHGTASYTKTDGTTSSVGDVDFKIAGKGNKPTAIDDEDGDDDDAVFDRNAKNALAGKIPTRLPEMSTSGGAIAMAAAMRRIAPPLPAASAPSNAQTTERFLKRGSRNSSESRPCHLANCAL